MGLIKNYIVFVGSWLVVFGSIIWGVAEGGYEPWILTVSSLVGVVANKDLLLNFWRKKRSLTPAQKIAAREKWRPIFESHFLEVARNNYREDAIIHDVDRLDIYPENREEKGISAWFRVGLVGTYHRGVLLGLRWTSIEERDGGWFEVKFNNSSRSMKVLLIGELPYEAIESVNFDGDQYYNKPHIFCHFENNGSPYERLFYGQEFQLEPDLPYYYREIAEHKTWPRFRWRFCSRSKKESIG